MADDPLNIDGEEWRDIPGWNGRYQASNLGRIRSVPHIRMKMNKGKLRPHAYGGKVLSAVRAGDYLLVLLMKDGTKLQTKVHRLVCAAFHGPPPDPTLQAAHNDGDASNNDPGNLRWATSAENQADKEMHGQVVRGERVGTAVLLARDVVMIRSKREAGASLRQLANEFGCSETTISRISRRTSWAHLP